MFQILVWRNEQQCCKLWVIHQLPDFKTVRQVLVHMALCNEKCTCVFESWAVKWRNLKTHNWQIKCLGKRYYKKYLTLIDFSDQTFDWQPQFFRSVNQVSDHCDVVKFCFAFVYYLSFFCHLFPEWWMFRSNSMTKSNFMSTTSREGLNFL